jgi:hypothetical protein
MANAYNLEGIKTELTKEINKKKAFLEAWENVSFPTKKDGSPFKIMSKNISGATYYTESYAMQPGEYMLKVHTWADGTGYVSSEVRAHELVKYLKDEAKRAKTQNYQPKIAYLEQVYTYDIDDIKQEVATKIEALRAEIIELETQLEIASEVFTNFRNAYAKAMNELEETSRKSKNRTLYYMVLDTIKSRYPYC